MDSPKSPQPVQVSVIYNGQESFPVLNMEEVSWFWRMRESISCVLASGKVNSLRFLLLVSLWLCGTGHQDPSVPKAQPRTCPGVPFWAAMTLLHTHTLLPSTSPLPEPSDTGDTGTHQPRQDPAIAHLAKLSTQSLEILAN